MLRTTAASRITFRTVQARDHQWTFAVFDRICRS